MRIHLRYTKREDLTLNFLLHQNIKTFVTYYEDYKGISGGGTIKLKGLLGTRGVGVNRAKEGSMYKMSLMRVLQLNKRILSAVKCKCPQVIAVRPSKKSYATRGTRAPSK